MQLNELEQIFDTVFPEQINLKSFEVKSKLCPRIWRNNELIRSVRIRLLDVAKDFLENFEEFDLVPVDIVLVGSMTGYAWSKYSDIDLHIIVDKKKYAKYGSPEVLKSLFDSKKNSWNDKHDILIYGYPIEMYIQDVSEENASEGVYSVKYNTWKKVPVRKNRQLDKDLIKKQAAQYINIIEKIEEFSKRKLTPSQYDMLYKTAEYFNDEIMNGRKNGLAELGETAPGNIVFKVLRRTGHIGRLKEVKTKLFDKICSLSL